MSRIHEIAMQVAKNLGATPAADPPARAIFDDGVVYINPGDEFCVEVHEAGVPVAALFVSLVANKPLIEAVVNIEDGKLTRAERRWRHRKLLAVEQRAFAGIVEIQHRDPLGLTGSKRTPLS